MSEHSLANQLLVSMPQLDDPNFHQTVTLICQHDDNGAIGVVVNRLTGHRLGDIFEQLSLTVTSADHAERPVFEGGPVYPELGLVVHDGSDEPTWESSLAVGRGLWLTSSRDILGAMANGNGPDRAIMSLGYAGWGAGQLEDEIRQNAWFSTPADSGIIFNSDVESKWHQAAALLGIDYSKMSTQVGHA